MRAGEGGKRKEERLLGWALLGDKRKLWKFFSVGEAIPKGKKSKGMEKEPGCLTSRKTVGKGSKKKENQFIYLTRRKGRRGGGGGLMKKKIK